MGFPQGIPKSSLKILLFHPHTHTHIAQDILNYHANIFSSSLHNIHSYMWEDSWGPIRTHYVSLLSWASSLYIRNETLPLFLLITIILSHSNLSLFFFSLSPSQNDIRAMVSLALRWGNLTCPILIYDAIDSYCIISSSSFYFI